MKIDVLFPAEGGTLPLEHSYLLYGALSRLVPAFHDAESGFRFVPITGEKGARGLLDLARFSTLRVRLPSEQIGMVLPLAGRTLALAEHSVRLGVPTVSALVPAPQLAARLVTYKHAVDPERFLTHTRQRLDEMKIGGEPDIPLVLGGERAGQPRRRVLRIKGRSIVGYSLQIAGLTADESICLQEAGLGGRLRMGCGFFVPHRPSPS